MKEENKDVPFASKSHVTVILPVDVYKRIKPIIDHYMRSGTRRSAFISSDKDTNE